MSRFRSTSGGMMLGRGITHDVVQSLNNKFQSPETEREFRDRAIFVFLTRTALRAHELVSLKWSAMIQTPEGDEVFQYRKKGGRDAFTAPGKKAIRAVREYHDAFGIQSDFLFVSLPGRNLRERHGLSTRSLQKIVNTWNVKTSAGKMIHPHALRHTAAQRAFDKAGSLAAQKLCGHSSPAITSAFYTRPYLSNVEELLDW
ncbi:MAG: tyrosine-type recombinase/integrase [Leptospirales bacterium]|nr:tyrosine-type recombinase/integrase [Leptospirales bacterium]